MNKFTITTLFALSILNLPIAQANWYAGGGLGVNSVSVNKDLTYPLGFSPLTVSHYDAAYAGFHGQIFAGNEFHIKDKVDVAVEGDIEWFNGNSEYRITNFFLTTGASALEELRYGFGLYLIPAFQLTDSTKLFIGPGVSTTRFTINSGETAGDVGVSGNYSQWLASYGFKGGIRSQINDKLDVHLTYQFNQFKSTRKTQVEPLSIEFVTGNYKPYSNSVMIGLLYNV